MRNLCLCKTVGAHYNLKDMNDMNFWWIVTLSYFYQSENKSKNNQLFRISVPEQISHALVNMFLMGNILQNTALFQNMTEKSKKQQQ